jgi:hypothetical protein
MPADWTSIAISIAALTVSIVSFIRSVRTERGSQVITYEQQRQQIRQQLVQAQLALGLVDAEVRWHLRREDDPPEREQWAETMHRVLTARRKFDDMLAQIEALPPGRSVEGRQFLERLAGEAEALHAQAVDLEAFVKAGPRRDNPPTLNHDEPHE